MAIIDCQFGGVPRYIRYCTLYRDQRNAQSQDACQYDLMKSFRNITIRVNLFYVNMFIRTPRQHTLVVIAVMRAVSELGRHFAAGFVQPQYDQGVQTTVDAASDPSDPISFCQSMDRMAGIWDRVAMGSIPIRNYPYTVQSADQHRIDEDRIINNIYGNIQLPVPDFPYLSGLEFFGTAYLLLTPPAEVLLGFPRPSPRLQLLMHPHSSDRRRSGEESTDMETVNLTRSQLRLGETPESRPISSKLIALAGYAPASPAAFMPLGAQILHRSTSTAMSASASASIGTLCTATSSRTSAAECSTTTSSVIYDRMRDSDTISSQQRQADLNRLRPNMPRTQYYSNLVQGAASNKRQKLGDGDR